VAADDVPLEALEVLVGDPGVGERADAGGDPIHGLVAGQVLLDERA
jgi:hypothetical protein